MKKHTVRKSLVTTFHCSDCGHELLIPMDDEVSESVKKKEAHFLDVEKDRPQGAYAFRNQLWIKPCEFCKRKAEMPVKAIAEALKGIKEFE